METETLTSYEQTKENHIEDERTDVQNEELDSPQNKNVCEDSSESIENISNQRNPQSIENKDNSSKDCEESKVRESANESEDEAVDQDSARIEAESDEDCEEEEKLLLSPTHSDKEYDTDEEDDHHISADENGADEDTDEEDGKVPREDETGKSEDDNKVEASESPVPEGSERTSPQPQVESVNEENAVGEEAEDVNDKTNDIEMTEEKEKPVVETVEKGVSDIEEKSVEVSKQAEAEENPAEAVSEKADSGEGNDGNETSEKEETMDTLDTGGEKVESNVPSSVGEKTETEDEKKSSEEKQDEDKVTPEENKGEEKSGEKDDETEVTKKNQDNSVTKEATEDEVKKGSESIEDDSADKTKDEKDLECPLLKETLTKAAEGDKLKEGEAEEDVEMDEDFDPSLLCPELSMEVDEAPVITENDPPLPENDGNKSPLRLYEPIFSTFVDEITGAEVDFHLTEEERKLREQTYGEKNPIQYTKIHCTACNVHLGSALDGQGNRFVHPLLKVLICKKCYHFYTSGEFEKDEDGSELYCRWCGQGGQVMCCANCEMVFCKKCIRINFDRKKIAAIRDSDDWLCFRCNPSQLIHLRIHCSEFMEYVQREMANIASLENPAAYLTTDYCQCCIPHKKKAAEPASSEPKRKRKKANEPDDPDYDPLRDQDSPPPLVATSAPNATPVVPAAAAATKLPLVAAKQAAPTQVAAGARPAGQQSGPLPHRMGHVPANAAFRTSGPGHQPRPRVQVVNQGPRPNPGYIKIIPGGARVPGASPAPTGPSAGVRQPVPRAPAVRAIRPNAPMKHEWFEKTVRAAARVNSNLSYTLTQLNRAQASATSVEGLAVVHNKLQEILSTSINSLIQIRKNLRTEFIAGIKNIRFPPKPQPAQQPSTSSTPSASQDDDVIFVSPATSPVPPPLPSPSSSSSSLPAAAMNLSPSVTLTKKPSPNTPQSAAKAGPSGVPRPGQSGTAARAGPSGRGGGAATAQSRPGPSGVSRNSSGTPVRNDQGGAPKSFLRVKSFSALQNVTSECITIPDDPVPETKKNQVIDDDDDDVTVIEKKVEVVTIIDDSPSKAPEVESNDKAEGVKKNLSQKANGLTNGSDKEAEEESAGERRNHVSIDRLDPSEKVKIMNTKIMLQRSFEIDELVKSKFGLLNGETSN